MAAVVEIQVQVNPTDSAAKIDGVAKELNTLGTAGAAAGQRAGAGMQQMGGHVATGLDSVRLLSQEFGLRMPRAIEAMLSRMPGVTSALSSVVGIMVGIAGVEIFSRAIEGSVKLYDNFISLNTEADKFFDTVEKMAREDLSSTRNLETTQRRMGNADQNATGENQIAQGLHSSGIRDLLSQNWAAGIGELINANGAAGEGVKNQQTSLQLGKTQIDQLHQQALAQIELNHAGDASLTGTQKINAEAQKKKQTDAETRGYDNRMQGFFGNAVPKDAGSAEQQIKDQTADAEAAAQRTVLGRETSLAIMKANDATAQAQLQGEALYFRKMQDDIRELTVELNNQGKAAEIPAKVREVNAKYFSDLSERMVKSQNESGSSVRRSSSAGLTGAARIYADQDEQVNKNNTDLAKDPGAQHTANVAAATEANNKLVDLQQQFAERMGTIEESRMDSTLNGYQRIAAEAAKTSSQITDDFNKSWGGSTVDTGSAQYIAAKKAEQSALTAVQAKAATDSAAFTNKENEETLRYDQQAAEAQRRVKASGLAGWTSDYQEALAEIQAKEQEQTKQLDDELAKRQISQTAYNQRIKDVDAEANAQVAAQAQDMQHKIAGTLESAFKDPAGAIKDIMQKMFFDILSQWVSQLGIFKGTFAASMGGMSPGGAHGGGAGGLIQSIASGGGGFRAPYAGGAGSSISGAGSSSAASMSGGGASIAGDSSSGGGFSVGSALSSARNIGGMLNFGGGASTPSAADNSVAMPSSDDTGIATIDTPSTGNVSGTPDDYATPSMDFSGGASTAMGLAGAAGGLYTGEQATVSAFEKGQPLQGAMADAAAGAAIGSIVPGIGTAIGAGIGAAVGLAAGALGAVTGMAGRMGARDYYNKSIYPQIEAAGSGSDYASGIAEADKDASNGMNYMVQHYGQDAANWVKSQYMDKELAYVITTITNRAKGGSGYLGASAAEFHTGGYIDGFGSLSTSSNEGYIHAMMGESVVNQQATSLHAPVINAMNSGASQSDVASMYLSGGKSNSAPSMGSGGDTHFHVHTLDTKTMTGWLRGGGARMISKAQNDMAGQYAGDGVIG